MGTSRRAGRARRPLLALVALVAALAVGYAVRAIGSDAPPAVHNVALSSLPAQAVTTVRRIENGGPFPYPADDGAVFHNDEHRLPSERDGYYHEYTVPTPGAPDRGARRIVAGGGQFYWTPDHYATFERVEVDR